MRHQRLKITVTNALLILTLCTCDLRNTDYLVVTREDMTENTANFLDPGSLFDAESRTTTPLIKKPVRVSAIGTPKALKGLNPAYFDLIGKPEEIDQMANLHETGED